MGKVTTNEMLPETHRIYLNHVALDINNPITQIKSQNLMHLVPIPCHDQILLQIFLENHNITSSLCSQVFFVLVSG